MYFVFFPVNKVYMAAWLRFWGGLRGLFYSITESDGSAGAFIKVWSLRGFWIVLFYISFDVIATLKGSHDGVAHWAHLGGFLVGMATALVLLITRQVNAPGDLLSTMLGKRAWPILGKPSQRKFEMGLTVLPRATPLN
jgi:membrane associated rhomboid family serine protease